MEVYLDHAATSHPKPPEVLSAVQEAMTTLNANPGRSGHRRALAAGRVLISAREAIGQLINAPSPECIAFCFNCTDALNTAIKGSLRVGDHVITSVLEHNSVLRVLEGLRARKLISVTMIDPMPDGMIRPTDFLAAVRPETSLCILTHASNVTGAIQPVAEVGRIMRGKGVRYLIDGAQAVGHIPVDVQALLCDLYAFPGHKGLLGPQGTGGLYVAPETPLRPFREGGTGSSSDSIIQPSERPECFESGTVNLPGIAGLLAGVRIVRLYQKERMEQERMLTSYLMDGLRALPGITVYTPSDSAARVGVVSFNVDSFTSSEIADFLDGQGIAVRGGLHCAPGAHRWLGTLRSGAVRASLGWKSSEADVDALVDALRRIIG